LIKQAVGTVNRLMKTYESGESVNESGDESGLRVDTAPNRPPISSPFASTEMDGKTGEKAEVLLAPYKKES
jgi:hypothetical protein